MFCRPVYSPFAPTCDYDYDLARQFAYEQRRREAIMLAQRRQREQEEAERLALLRAQAYRRQQLELAHRQRAYEEEQLRRQAHFAELEAVHRRQQQLQRRRLDRAASIIQRAVRQHLAAKPRHSELDRIACDFASLSSSFVMPSVSDLVLTDSGSLAFVPANVPLRAHEEDLTRLLTRLDAVDSAGNPAVRAHRRQLVLDIERELERIEALKMAARDARNSVESAAPSSDALALDEAPQVVDAAASVTGDEQQDANIPSSPAASNPTPQPLDDAAAAAAASPSVTNDAVSESEAIDHAMDSDAVDTVADSDADVAANLIRARSPSLQSLSSDDEEDDF